MIDFESDRRFRHIVFTRGVEIPKWALLQIIQALPDDALLFRCDFDFARGEYSLCFWSGEFERVLLGHEIPSIIGWIDTEQQLAGLASMWPSTSSEGPPTRAPRPLDAGHHQPRQDAAECDTA